MYARGYNELCKAIELIETLWNVNEEVPDILAKLDEGINRNIVECK